MIFQTIPDFNFQSHQGRAVCAVCGTISKPGQIVFRPPHADDFDGFFDICENCIREAADHLGLQEVAPLQEAQAADTAAIVKLHEELSSAREALATVTRENVRLQDTLEELAQPIEVSYEELAEAEEFDDA